MQVSRLAKRPHANLDGAGAAITGGRWNSKGKPVVYTASCGALAVVEYLAHLTILPKGLMLMLIEIPDTLEIEKVRSIPADPLAFLWRATPSPSIAGCFLRYPQAPPDDQN